MAANPVIQKRNLLQLLSQDNLAALPVSVAIVGEVQITVVFDGVTTNIILTPPDGPVPKVYNLLDYAPVAAWRSSTSLMDIVNKGFLNVFLSVDVPFVPAMPLEKDCCDLAVMKPLNAQNGDLLTFVNGSWVRLPVGTSGQVLSSTGTAVSWSSAGSGVLAGDVVGPSGTNQVHIISGNAGTVVLGANNYNRATGNIFMNAAAGSVGMSALGAGSTADLFSINIAQISSNGVSVVRTTPTEALVQGANTVRVVTNSVDRITVDSAGRVGVGTGSPNEIMTLEGALSLREMVAPTHTANYGKLYVKDTDGVLYFKNDTGTEFNLLAGGIGGSGVAGQVAVWDGVSSLSSYAGFAWNSIDNELDITGDLNVIGATNTASLTVSGVTNLNGDTYIDGNLSVIGTITAISSEEVLINDNHLYLNNNYTVPVAQTGGLVVNRLPTATSTTVSGAYTAGVPAVSNPTVGTVGLTTFSVNDIVQFGGSGSNDGLYEVLSHIAGLLTIRGVGTTGTVEDFTQNQFAAGASDGATITKVGISVMRAGVSGAWEVAQGNVTPLVFSSVATGASVLAGDVVGPFGSNTVETLTGNAGTVEIAATNLSKTSGSLFVVNNDGQIVIDSYAGATPFSGSVNIYGDTRVELNAFGVATLRLETGLTRLRNNTLIDFRLGGDTLVREIRETHERMFFQQRGANGTAAIPTYSFSGSTTHGMYSGGANLLAFSTASTERLSIGATGNIVINETGANADFRVEGQTEPNLLFIDASANRIGVGIGAPEVRLHVFHDVNAGAFTAIQNPNAGTLAYSSLTLSENGGAGKYMTLNYQNTNFSPVNLVLPNQGRIFCGPGATNGFLLSTDQAAAPIVFAQGSIAATSERLRINSTAVIVNEPGQNIDFRVEGQGEPNLLFTDASANRVGVGTNTPGALFEAFGNVNAGTSIQVVNPNAGTGAESGLALVEDGPGGKYFIAAYYNTNRTAAGLVLPSQGAFFAGPQATNGILFATNHISAPIVFSQGSLLTTSDRLRINSTAVIVNEPGQDIDFRVEGVSEQNLIFADASANSVGIGVAPSTRFHVEQDSTGTVAGLVRNPNAGVLAAAMWRVGNNSSADMGSFGAYSSAFAVAELANRVAVVSTTSAGGVTISASAAAGNIRFHTGDTFIERRSITTTEEIFSLPQRGATGSVSEPTYSFTDNTNLGVYRSAANTLGFTTAGVLRRSISDTLEVFTLQQQGGDGTAAAPTYGFSASTTHGLYSAGPNALALSTDSTERMRVNATGQLSVGTATANELVTIEGRLSLRETAGVPTTSAGYGKIYAKTDKVLYFLDSDGTEHDLLSGGGGTPAGIDGQVQFNDGGIAFGADATFHWDNTEKRLGLGTASPATRLHVVVPTTQIAVTADGPALVSGAGRALVNIVDQTAFAADTGGGIFFTGRINAGGTLSEHASIHGSKTNATSDNTAGSLVLSTRTAAGALTARRTITSTEETFTLQQRGAAGSAAAPTYSFTGATNRGMYAFGGSPFESIGFAVAGALKFTVAELLNESHQRLLVPVGSAATASLSFSGQTAGFFSPGSNSIGFTTASTERARIDGAGQLSVGVATANEMFTLEGRVSLRTTTAPTSTANYGKLYTLAADARPYYMEPTGDQAHLLAKDLVQTVTWAATTNIDFSPALPESKALTLGGNTTFGTANLGVGRKVSLRVVCDGTNRTLAFPGWQLQGAFPSLMLAGTRALLTLESFGTLAADVVARWTPEGLSPDSLVGQRTPIRTITASETLTLADCAIMVDATAGVVNVTLPAVAPANGYFFMVKKIDASANAVNILSAATIDGLTSRSLTTQYQTLRPQSDGTVYWVAS